MAEAEETLLSKKTNNYSSKLENFQTENELMVEITLSEYRELITKNSIAEYKAEEAKKEKFKKDKENEILKKEKRQLEMELLIYQKIYEELEKAQNMKGVILDVSKL